MLKTLAEFSIGRRDETLLLTVVMVTISLILVIMFWALMDHILKEVNLNFFFFALSLIFLVK
jgi:hypothetical protein